MYVYVYVRDSTSTGTIDRGRIVVAMLMLNYLKSKDGLRDPKDSLSQCLSSRAIAAANSEVAKEIGGSATKKRGEYK